MAHQNQNNYQQQKRQENNQILTTSKVLSTTEDSNLSDSVLIQASAQNNNNNNNDEECKNISQAQENNRKNDNLINSDDDCQMVTTTTTAMIQPSPPIVYGELSILGYNGYIPNIERNGRRNRSKFLLCKRVQPNGIKKSRHYIVKQQPQATKAIQDKDLHSISYTFSRSQTIIVEYRQDEHTDMFQIGRSSEDPIDFVVMDTLATNVGEPTSHHKSQGGSAVKSISTSQYNHNNNYHNNHHSHQQHNNFFQQPPHNENNQHNIISGDILSGISRLHRHLAKVGDEIMYGNQAVNRNRPNCNRNQPQTVLLNYPQPNISNLPPMMADHFRQQESAIFQQQQQQQHQQQQHHHHHQHQHQHHLEHNIINPLYQSSSSQQQLSPQQIQSSMRTAHHDNLEHLNQQQHGSSSSRHNNSNNNNNNNTNHVISSKRSHATQSTISRFACRILVDRHPPYTARIYAAGFDSSKNIFLGEKATKWEQNNTIDGLTTNGVLLMHPKRKSSDFYEQTNKESSKLVNNYETTDQTNDSSMKLSDINEEEDKQSSKKQFCSTTNELDRDLQEIESAVFGHSYNNAKSSERTREESNSRSSNNNSNDNSNDSKLAKQSKSNTEKQYEESGGVWREVSVDGGIYAIRESRSAAQKGTRIEGESNILQDGTLIDLCGATLLWRSVDGFKASPTKKSLEEKIDLLNASRPQCPVGLNTLVIPRKPIIPAYHQQHHSSGSNYHHHHHHHRSNKAGESSSKDNDKSSHQPYVYLKCGHVQGYHDWGATDKLNQRTCPICLSVGTVAKLSMGLEPSFYVDSGPLTHVFNPCGHMASERTVKYWCSIKIPHGTHFFHAICPFCATPLATNELQSTKLIFQDDLD